MLRATTKSVVCLGLCVRACVCVSVCEGNSLAFNYIYLAVKLWLTSSALPAVALCFAYPVNEAQGCSAYGVGNIILV